MATWPGSLPQKPIHDGGYQETGPDLTLSTNMDDGPPKRRKYTTANTDILQLRFFFTSAQRATHDTFYRTTTNGGADPFDYTHPVTGAAITVAYKLPEGKPRYTHVGGNGSTLYFHCDVAFEIIP